jgi:hypothetical protein
LDGQICSVIFREISGREVELEHVNALACQTWKELFKVFLMLGGGLTGRQLGVFQGLSQLVHGNMLVKEAKKKRRAHAIITL